MKRYHFYGGPVNPCLFLNFPERFLFLRHAAMCDFNSYETKVDMFVYRNGAGTGKGSHGSTGSPA
jgi:hypothetical protein